MEFAESGYELQFPELGDIIKFSDHDEGLDGVAVTKEKKTKKFFEYKMVLFWR